MYAIAFDLKIDDLKKEYGEPYNKAYDEIRQELQDTGFTWFQGNIYVYKGLKNSLTAVYKAINKLSKIEWFKERVQNISAFKVENWSDFTNVVKNGI